MKDYFPHFAWVFKPNRVHVVHHPLEFQRLTTQFRHPWGRMGCFSRVISDAARYRQKRSEQSMLLNQLKHRRAAKL
jgi:hypothetical protein